MKSNQQTQTMVVTAIFTAIILLLTFTPLGFVPIGPINATTVHIPVIIGALVLGPKRGAFLGLVFGLASLIHSTMAPTVLGFIFSPFVPVIGTNHGSWLAVVIALVPRVLLGVIPYYYWQGLQKIFKSNQRWTLGLSGFLSSLTHTVIVMGLITLFFKDQYAQALGKSVSHINEVILSIILTNGIIEALLAALVSAAVTNVLIKRLKK